MKIKYQRKEELKYKLEKKEKSITKDMDKVSKNQD